MLPGLEDPVTKGEIYGFGDVRVDAGRMTASRGGEAIPLEPKAFDLLVYLIEHRNRLVTKDELLDGLWPGTFVTPNVLRAPWHSSERDSATTPTRRATSKRSRTRLPLLPP